MTLPLSTDEIELEQAIRRCFNWALIDDKALLDISLSQLNEPARIAAACAADRLLRALLPTDEVN